VNLGPGGRDRFPAVDRSSFDASMTTFTMRVRLQADRDYEFVLGAGFRSADGFPIRPLTVRFRTGPARTAAPP
jgi:hypothetical protein